MNGIPREVRIPLTWNLTGQKILFVGGGQAALSKLKALEAYQPILTLVAPFISKEVVQLLDIWPEKEILQREFRLEDLEGIALAYIFTDNPDVNRTAAQSARNLGIPYNAAGDPGRNFTSPASIHTQGFTVSVASGGQDISGAVALRDQIALWLEMK